MGSLATCSPHGLKQPPDALTTNTSTSKAAGIPERQTIPILSYFTTPAFKNFALRCAVRPNKKANPLTWIEVDDIVLRCHDLQSTVGVSKSLLESYNIKNTLLSLQNRHERQQFNFPATVVAAAREAYNHLEAGGWGVPKPKNEEFDDESSARHVSGSFMKNIRAQRQPVTADSTSSHSDSFTLKSGEGAKFPSSTHPIWGDRGIMRGMFINFNGKTKNASFRPDCDKRNAKVYGHNKLSVGQWWPRQRCAVRDGAHAHHMAGISQSAEGVYSIVVSSAYESSDLDNGETIWYSSPSCMENRHADEFLKQSIKAIEAMDASFGADHDIRVLRSAGAGWPGRPSVGIRYDGLYRIVDSEVKRNEYGGVYKRWRLIRQPGQPALESLRSRPTPREQDDYERILEYY